MQGKGSVSLNVATVGIMGALMAVLSYASIVVPPPLGSIDASSVLIFLVAILYGPVIGVSVTCIGQFVGKSLLISFYGFPAVFIPGVVAVRGVEALLIGIISRKTFKGGYGLEVLAMIIGVLWETAGFVIADLYLFGAAAIVTVLTIVDLVWVPFGIAAIAYVRTAFKAEYLDEHLGILGSGTRWALLIGSLVFIICCWILIFLAGATGLLMGPLFPP